MDFVTNAKLVKKLIHWIKPNAGNTFMDANHMKLSDTYQLLKKMYLMIVLQNVIQERFMATTPNHQVMVPQEIQMIVVWNGQKTSKY